MPQTNAAPSVGDESVPELKPCPFCGGGATFEHLENTRWSIGCADIDGDCMGFQSLQTFARKAEAITTWNTRPTEDETPADAGEGVERYLSDRFEWAAPGDQQEDAWIVRFCDNDVRDMLFTGADAERDAWEAWNKHAPGYNMYVFRLARLAHPTPTDTGLVGDAFNDPKYDFQNGRIINRASGEVIPPDEPAFVFRARDIHAAYVLERYANQVGDQDHREAIRNRVADFRNFAAAHPERMKEPDTALAKAKAGETDRG